MARHESPAVGDSTTHAEPPPWDEAPPAHNEVPPAYDEAPPAYEDAPSAYEDDLFLDPDSGHGPDEDAVLPVLQSFEDVVALAEAKRELKLKNALLEQVRLVHFKPGNIELNPLPAAPQQLTQELMRKLRAWTGRVWIVAVSDKEGAEPLGIKRRAEAEREIELVRAHPAVKEMLQHFPGARIAAVRATAPAPVADGGEEEPEQFSEDGTN